MSASQTPPSGSPPAATPAGGDPSMEDILASIRRILSEDEAQPGEAKPAAAAEEPRTRRRRPTLNPPATACWCSIPP